ncbi:MAG: hypothetical protein U0992_00805 [Planctomycetaceae bacterium]
MGTTAMLSPSMTAEPIRLRFETTFAEQSRIMQQVWTSRHPQLLIAGGVFMVATAAFNAGLQLGSDAGGFAWFFGLNGVFQICLGWNLLSNNALGNWLGRRFSRGVSRSDLALDANGIRGTFETPNPYGRSLEIKHIAYGWRKVRRIHRVADDLVLEFHGGGMVTLPARVFSSRDEQRQCLDWAEQGLAEQQRKPANVRVA